MFHVYFIVPSHYIDFIYISPSIPISSSRQRCVYKTWWWTMPVYTARGFGDPIYSNNNSCCLSLIKITPNDFLLHPGAWIFMEIYRHYKSVVIISYPTWVVSSESFKTIPSVITGGGKVRRESPSNRIISISTARTKHSAQSNSITISTARTKHSAQSNITISSPLP